MSEFEESDTTNDWKGQLLLLFARTVLNFNRKGTEEALRSFDEHLKKNREILEHAGVYVRVEGKKVIVSGTVASKSEKKRKGELWRTIVPYRLKMENKIQVVPKSDDSGILKTIDTTSGSLHRLNSQGLRQRMKDCIEVKGLTYAEIGKSMGYHDTETAKNKVSYLVNRAENPGVFTVIDFCEAVGTNIQELLDLNTDVEHIVS